MTELLIVLVCIALNAALAALEVAFVSASKADLTARASADDPRVREVFRLREMSERTLSAIQVGMTLMGMVSGAAGGAGAQEVLSPFFESQFALGAGTAKTVALVMVAIPLMFATVVIGERFSSSVQFSTTLTGAGGAVSSGRAPRKRPSAATSYS